MTELPDEETWRPATPQERFAAFFTDTAICAVVAGLWFLLLGKVKASPSTLLYASTTASFYFLYYLLTEGVMTASPGKLLAGLRVRKRRGGTPSLIAILIRNLLRLVDYPLFFVTAVGLMEATEKHQRLGDLLADTTVVREIAFEARRLPSETTPLAGATRRALAWVLDLALVIPLGYGLLLLVPVSRPLLAAAGVNAVLPLTLLALALSETLFQTTFGKALLGMKVAQEDGRPARFAAVWVRNVFKLLDANPVGYLCVFLSSRKQRPGDAAAGTLVFRDRRGLRGWMAVPFLAVLALIAAHSGLKNPDSFLKKNLDLRIGPTFVDPVPRAVKRLPVFGLGILIDELKFGLNDQEENPGKTFEPGQAVYVLFRISGYAVQNNKAWIQADLKVRNGRGNVVFDRMNAINSSLPVGARKSAKLITRFSLNPQSEPGTYEVSLKIRDMFAGKYTEETSSLTVRY
jgi:uncharacterized RDD family membrane protein YckC